jgi:hypothetical protein
MRAPRPGRPGWRISMLLGSSTAFLRTSCGWSAGRRPRSLGSLIGRCTRAVAGLQSSCILPVPARCSSRCWRRPHTRPAAGAAWSGTGSRSVEWCACVPLLPPGRLRSSRSSGDVFRRIGSRRSSPRCTDSHRPGCRWSTWPQGMSSAVCSYGVLGLMQLQRGPSARRLRAREGDRRPS